MKIEIVERTFTEGNLKGLSVELEIRCDAPRPVGTRQVVENPVFGSGAFVDEVIGWAEQGV